MVKLIRLLKNVQKAGEVTIVIGTVGAVIVVLEVLSACACLSLAANRLLSPSLARSALA